MNNNQSKVAIISIHPSPYRDTILNELSKYYDIIYYYGYDKGHREWNWEVPVSKYRILTRHLKFIKNDTVSLDLISLLIRNKYKLIVIPGYSNINSIICIIYSLLKQIPFILSLDTINDNNKNRIKLKIIKYLYNKASAFWVPGKASREYILKKYKINKPIIEGYYCINDPSKLSNMNNRMLIKNDIITNDKYFKFLSVGNMINKRKFPFLVKIIGKLKNKSNIYLVLIGDGIEKNEVKNICKINNYSNVIILNSKPYSQLYYYYKHCNAYIYLGGEPFSTAMEYASKVGLPIITTNQVGFSYEIEDPNLKKLIICDDDVEMINNAIYELIKNYKFYKQKAENFKNIIISKRDPSVFANLLNKLIIQKI